MQWDQRKPVWRRKWLRDWVLFWATFAHGMGKFSCDAGMRGAAEEHRPVGAGRGGLQPVDRCGVDRCEVSRESRDCDALALTSLQWNPAELALQVTCRAKSRVVPS